jgi:FAD/FMN-containing dehydrogenase
VLSAGVSGHRRLRFGAVRDLLLEAQYVSAQGELLRAGAPVVKNVSGFDVCRLLVGSHGTVGQVGEVVLRCRPAPKVSMWLCTEDPSAPTQVRSLVFAPSSILWDGTCTWVLLEGDPVDVKIEAAGLARLAMVECASGPVLPTTGRVSVDPASLPDRAWEASLNTSPRSSDHRWVAEIGVGTVHTSWPTGRRRDPNRLERDVKRTLDPTRRFSPGRLGL